MKITASEPDIETICKRIKKEIYDLQPDFQRDEVWNREKQQKLIDSIMRGWHIPPIYVVSIDNSDNFEVLDGKQRLTAIYHFLEGKFSFNSGYLPGIDNFYELNGKKFIEFPEKWKTKFLTWSIKIFEVREVSKDEATELFLRLNQAVMVRASEKRNCIYGPIRNFLRKELLFYFKDFFTKDRLGFQNRRMSYQDILDTLFFLEENNSINIKPTSRALEEMYFNLDLRERTKDNLRRNLELLDLSLRGFKYKLTKSTLISYYWLVRELEKLNKFDEDKLSNFFRSFEEWRDNQIELLTEGKSPSRFFVEFNRYLSYGWLDPESLNGRHNLLLKLFYYFETVNNLEGIA